MPPGLFDMADDGNMKKLFSVVADEANAAFRYVGDQRNQFFPRHAKGPALERWARLVKIPYYSDEEARPIILSLLSRPGGANAQIYLRIMKELGMDDSDFRIRPFIEDFNCNSECDNFLFSDPRWYNFFIVFLPTDRNEIDCNSECDRPVVAYQKESILKLFRESRPAQTEILFLFY